MEGTYDVLLGGQKQGNVTVKNQGLYRQFLCTCKLSGEVMYDLMLLQDGMQMKLGILTPENGMFTLQTKFPAKQLGQGSPTFSLKPRHEIDTTLFVTVRPEEPFAYIRQLEDAYLSRRNGELGIVIQNK